MSFKANWASFSDGTEDRMPLHLPRKLAGLLVFFTADDEKAAIRATNERQVGSDDFFIEIKI
jgi:hypothetical protein